MEYAENGIQLLNADYVNLIENAIYQNNSDIYQYAFNSINSNFCFLDHNLAMLTPTNQFSINNGYLFTNSENNKIIGNLASNTKVGFEFLGSCPRTDFILNKMNNHEIGLYLNDLTIIDDQIDKGNRWFGNYTQYGAQNDAWNNLPGFSIFLVNPSQGTEYDPANPNLGWFVPTSNLAPIEGFIISDCSIGERNIPFNVSTSDQLTMQKVALDSTFYDEAITNASKLLFEKFSLNDSVLNSSPIYINYVDSLSTKCSGKLSTTRLKLGDKNVYSSGYNFEPYQLVLNSMLDSLLVLDSSNYINFTLEANSSFKKLKTAVRLLSIDLKNYIDPLKVENNLISPSNIVNENEKKINTILTSHYLKTNTNYSFDERNIIPSEFLLRQFIDQYIFRFFRTLKL
jgi:hypothetical protein